MAQKSPITATHFILRGLLLPLSRENILLSHKPPLFFAEREKISPHKQQALRVAYHRAQKTGLIDFDESALPRLTQKGLLKAAPFESRKLSNKGKLLVIFDIPEERRKVRHEFRSLLKNLGFIMVQQSVWITDTDYRDVLKAAVYEYNLKGHVEIYEAAQIFS